MSERNLSLAFLSASGRTSLSSFADLVYVQWCLLGSSVCISLECLLVYWWGTLTTENCSSVNLFFFFCPLLFILSVCRSSLYLWILSLCPLYWKYFPYLLFHHPVLSNSLWPHGLQHARPPHCSSSPGVCQNSCSLHWWCHPAILSSDTLFSSCPWSFPASETFPVSCLFTSDDQNTEASVYDFLTVLGTFRNLL